PAAPRPSPPASADRCRPASRGPAVRRRGRDSNAGAMEDHGRDSSARQRCRLGSPWCACDHRASLPPTGFQMTPSTEERRHRCGHAATRAARWLPAALALLVAGCASHQPIDPPEAAASVPPAAAPADVPQVAVQVRKAWRFDADGIRFDNLLPAARLSGVERLGEGRYRIDIAPETEPVNPSAWYGFRIHADAPRTLELRFAYAHGHRHRYVPKLSADGREWREAGGDEYRVDDDGVAHLQLQLETGALHVSAQPPFLPGDFEAWSADVAARLGVEPRTFGSSVQGRPLHVFEFGAVADTDAPVLLVLGRQHPPENTGTQALTGFIESLAADTPQA